jgi:FMN reductase
MPEYLCRTASVGSPVASTDEHRFRHSEQAGDAGDAVMIRIVQAGATPASEEYPQMQVLGGGTTSPARVVAIGGSTRPGSTTEQLLRMAAERIHPDAEVRVFAGPALLLPHYVPGKLSNAAHDLVAAARAADVLILGSPGYHGCLSGTVKNAIDYLEELAMDDPPYLDGKVVGCVATAYGWQAAVNTLSALRQVVAALRGWSTPYGIAVNVSDGYLTRAGALDGKRLDGPIDIMAGQIRQFMQLTGRDLTQPVAVRAS